MLTDLNKMCDVDMYAGCSIYNETVLITFTFYEIQRHK